MMINSYGPPEQTAIASSCNPTVTSSFTKVETRRCGQLIVLFQVLRAKTVDVIN